MYQITTHDATSTTARSRMPELYLSAVAGAFIEGRVKAGVVTCGISVATPASFKDATPGVRAWSPPV
jgi:hypothetical protein